MLHVDAVAVMPSRLWLHFTCQGSIEQGCTLPVVMLLQVCLACLHLKSTTHLTTLTVTCSKMHG